jgi:hypothetical protein
MTSRNPLVIFHDNDTGEDTSYIHTTEEVPTIEQLGTVLAHDEDGNELITDFRAVGDVVYEGNTGVVIVKYNSNGWGPNLVPQIGTITIILQHGRTEQPGTFFLI